MQHDKPATQTTEPDRLFWLIWEGFMWLGIVGGLVAAGWLLLGAHYG